MFKKPSRIIPKNYRNITGKFSSNKSDRLISYESKLERDFLYLFELENIIIKIVEQPTTIKYKLDEKEYRYTPDFYLQTHDGHNDMIIEVKYKNELQKKFKELKPKFKAIIHQMKDRNIDFYLFTDTCTYIRSDEYKFNVHFLINYNDCNTEHFKIIKDLFLPYITIEDLLNKFSNDRFKQFEILNTLWCMIRRKILIIDMYEKLTTSTKLIKFQNYETNIKKGKYLS